MTACVLEDDHLKGDLQLRDDQVWHHHAASGNARLIPERGVVLVVKDEHGRDLFGFMKYPSELGMRPVIRSCRRPDQLVTVTARTLSNESLHHSMRMCDRKMNF